jgi:DtxR family Mn-dependent transcriptional regulator
LSPTKEDYLKILFELGGKTLQISNKEIANRLNISPPTVTEMMNSLVKVGWVVYTPYKGSMLTEDGTKYAKKLIRKHRLWEVFLVEKLDIDINEVHREAELLEHATSGIVADRLERFLEYPEYCPHGGAINPDLMDQQEIESFNLPDIAEGETVIISRIVDDKRLLQYFKNHDLNIGDQATIIEIDKELDLITLQKKGSDKDIQISITIGQYLFVEKI